MLLYCVMCVVFLKGMDFVKVLLPAILAAELAAYKILALLTAASLACDCANDSAYSELYLEAVAGIGSESLC